MERYDVIIIGSGAGGGTLASRLAPSGKRILLLERGDWLPREPQNWTTQRCLHRQPLRLGGHLVRRKGRAFPAAGPLLRRRGDQAVRRRALSPSQGGLRRAPASRRHLARMADPVRRARAVLHPRRAAVRGPRRAGRGPDRTTGECPLSLPGRRARASDPAAGRRSRRGRIPAVPRPVRREAERRRHAVQQVHPLSRRATASPASSTPSRTPRFSACALRSSTRTSRC